MMITKDELMPGIKVSLDTAIDDVIKQDRRHIKDLSDIVSEEISYVDSDSEGEFICGIFTGVKIAARFLWGEMLKNPYGLVGALDK